MKVHQHSGTKLARSSREGSGFMFPLGGMDMSIMRSSKAGPFEVLERYVLPPLIATRCADGRLVLRVWSAGCPTGDEVDSLAAWPDWLLAVV